MQLNHFGSILRRSLWIIIITTLVGGIVGAALAATQRPVYSATARMLFTATAPTEASVSQLVSANTILTTRVATYLALVGSPVVLDPAIQELGLAATSSELSSKVSAATAGAGTLIAVSASSSDPASAAALANAVAKSLGEQVVAADPEASAEPAGPTTDVEIVQPAAPPSSPSAPDLLLYTGLGLAIGFAIGIVIAAVRGYNDTRVRNRTDIETAVPGSPVLGGFGDAATKGFVVAGAPTGEAAESYRQFRAQLRAAAAGEGARRLLVVTPRGSDSAAAVAANLAAVIAEEDVSVILVDADLRRGTAAAFVNATGGPGVSDLLDGKAELDGAVVATSVPRLSVLPAGTATDTPYPLLASPTMKHLMDELSARADVVVVVVPPLLDVADGLIAAQYADEAVVVVRSGRSRKRDLAEVAARLESARTPISAVALAGVPRRGPDAQWR